MIEYDQESTHPTAKKYRRPVYMASLACPRILEERNREMFSKVMAELENSLKGDERFSG